MWVENTEKIKETLVENKVEIKKNNAGRKYIRNRTSNTGKTRSGNKKNNTGYQDFPLSPQPFLSLPRQISTFELYFICCLKLL